MTCEKCMHKDVCKYISETMAFAKEMEGKITPAFVEVKVSCKKYQENKPTPREPFNNEKINDSHDEWWKKTTIDPLIVTYSNDPNPCVGCSIYEAIKEGKTVINDACSFCSKNPYKVTCTSATNSTAEISNDYAEAVKALRSTGADIK